MKYIEGRFQRWRALAIYSNGDEGLLCLGDTYTEVKETYHIPYFELLQENERKGVRLIQLQRWNGKANYGYWENQLVLDKPRV